MTSVLLTASERVSLAELANEYVICRTLGHAWDDNPTASLDSDLWRAAGTALALRCTRCTTERFDYLGKDMTVFARYYRYPPRYRTARGELTDRPSLRGELFARSLLLRRATTAAEPQVRRRRAS